MVLDKLSDSLKNTLKKITFAVFVDEKLVNELVKDVQRSLLQSDVNVKLVLDLTNKIKERVLKEESPKTLSKKEYLIQVLYEELTKFLGGSGAKIEMKKKPFKLMLVGLFGNGKTTCAGKLANYYKKRGLKVAVMTTDTWRPAAFDQLEQLAKKVGVDFMGDKKSKDPAKIFKKFESELSKYDLVIVDTAGRDALSEELITELNSIHKAVNANETLLVMGADLGQAAEKQAKTFHETCGVTGIIITKLDGTAKGGGALAAAAITGAPVKFIGIGEKVDDLEEFRPEGFVGRLLGMGDLEALLEKAKGAISEEEAQDLGNKFLKGDFSLLDLYEQMQAVRKMGPLAKVMEMIPGMSQVHLPKEMLEVQEEKLTKWKFILDSCTKEELENPEDMDGSRVDRIAKGSGCSSGEIRSLLKQYKQSKKMVKMFKGGSEKDMQKMMQKFQGKMPFKM